MPPMADRQAREALGAAIQKARGSRSQEWLAEQMGVAQTTISKWEVGDTSPRFNRLAKLEEVLGLPPRQLRAIMLGDDEDPSPTREGDEPAVVPTALAGALRGMTDDEIAQLIGYAARLKEERRNA